MAGVDVLAYDHAVRQIAQAYRPNVSVHISAFNASEENSVLRSAILHEFRNCCQYTSLIGGHEIVMHSGVCAHRCMFRRCRTAAPIWAAIYSASGHFRLKCSGTAVISQRNTGFGSIQRTFWMAI